MKALVIEGVQKAVVKEVPVPEFKKDGMLIKTMANGVCRSDWHVWLGIMVLSNQSLVMSFLELWRKSEVM